MKNFTKLILGLIFLLLLLWIANWFYMSELGETLHKETALEAVINECEGISENSVAHMVAVVEFQKLEIAGRKARVMQRCMNDHGFVENVAWSAYAKPIAEQNAKLNKISFDEALESLKRTHMLAFNAGKSLPLYWVKK